MINLYSWVTLVYQNGMLVMCFQVTVAHLIISVLFLLLVLGGIIGLLLKPHLEEGGKSLYGGLC